MNLFLIKPEFFLRHIHVIKLRKDPFYLESDFFFLRKEAAFESKLKSLRHIQINNFQVLWC